MADPRSIIREAARAFGRADLDAAERACRLALQAQPNQPDGLHMLGVLAVQRGRAGEAEALIRRALDAEPERATFRNSLGSVLQVLGRSAEARRCYERAIELDGGLVDARQNLGTLLLACGQAERAAIELDAAARLAPDDAGLHNKLGVARRRQGDVEAAAGSFHQAVQLAPDNPAARHNLGATLLDMGRIDEAEPHLSHAVRLRPDHADTLTAMGNLLRTRRRWPQAAGCYRRAIAAADHDPEPHRGLGAVEIELGRPEAALTRFQAAAHLRPEAAGPHDDLAYVHQLLGQFDQAVEHARLALERDGDHVSAHARLLRLHPQSDEDPAGHVAALARAATSTDVPTADRAEAHFALGDHLDRGGRYDEAFEHYRQGNGLVDARFDADAHAAQVDRSMATFSDAMLAGRSGIGHPTRRPVFVVGMPRSGTTLVEQILAAHGGVYGAGELDLLRQAALGVPHVLGSDRAFPEAASELDADAAARLARHYLDGIAALDADAQRVVDKAPGNFHFLGLVALLLPNASVIHVTRHPLDSCLSCYFQKFVHLDFSFDLATIGRYHRQYQRLMHHWERVCPGRILEVRYESLVDDLESVSRRMVGFLGLDWDPACLAYHQQRRLVRTASVLQARRPIYRGSVERWRHYDRHLGPLRQALGWSDAVAA